MQGTMAKTTVRKCSVQKQLLFPNALYSQQANAQVWHPDTKGQVYSAGLGCDNPKDKLRLLCRHGDLEVTLAAVPRNRINTAGQR